MEPRIQYAQTADGVSIAYWTLGEGTPLVVVPPPPVSHAQLAWEMWGYVLKPLVRRFRVVWYDSQGGTPFVRPPRQSYVSAVMMPWRRAYFRSSRRSWTPNFSMRRARWL